ncbi:hypothetical protein ABZ281_39920, partial [Streptomyces sp. NPDC006265]|uniref:hypothetical protein n=1 Tax=Streptomyces sp. NPDC006265 TaxID=3156740 RepID=UPI0033B69C7B
MDIATSQTRRPTHASPRPGRGTAAEMDTPLAVFVGDRFAAALHEAFAMAALMPSSTSSSTRRSSSRRTTGPTTRSR